MKKNGASRLDVLKTYKIFVGGQFPRTESGRYYPLINGKRSPIANICLCSRKDLRDAVVAARGAWGGWHSRSAFNRGQIVYRIAEVMEQRREEFVAELVKMGSSTAAARKEVEQSIDRIVYFAGWADKFQQVFSSVNPVSAPYFNFSLLESMGVVGIVAPSEGALLGLVSTIAPVIVGGNTCVILASFGKPLCAVTFGEVLATSDLPAGVVNILTGDPKELLPHLSSHMDVNAIVGAIEDSDSRKVAETSAALNVKRLAIRPTEDWLSLSSEDPYRILDTLEVKTTWHPIGQ